MSRFTKYIGVLSVSIILAATGCQPNPSTQAVVNKGNEDLMKIINATPSLSTAGGDEGGNSTQPPGYQAPSEYKDQFSSKNGKTTIILDAAVCIPNVSSYPVIKVAPDDLTQAQADQYIGVLTQGKALHYPQTDQDLSKSEIIDRITALKLGKYSDLNAFDPAAYQKSIAPQIARLQELLKTAPEASRKRVANGKFEVPVLATLSPDQEKNMSSIGIQVYNRQIDKNKNMLSIDVESDLDNGTTMELQITKSGERHISLRFFNPDIRTGGKVLPDMENLSGLKLSAGNAKAIAGDIVNKLGLHDLTIAAAGSEPSGKLYGDEETYNDLPKCYVIYFTRNVNGIQTTYVSENYPIDGSREKPPAEFDFWPDELISVSIDDSGLIELSYSSPAKVIETLNGNVRLKPFSDIMDRFREQMQIGGAWQPNPQVISRRVTINKIVLGMGRVAIKDKPGEYMFIPVWDFFGNCVEKYPPSFQDINLDANNEIVEDTFGHSYLTINAIDGSVIDRSLGY